MFTRLSASAQSILSSGSAQGQMTALQQAGVVLRSDNINGFQVQAERLADAESIISAYSGSATELAYAKQQKITALEVQYENLIAGGRLYSVIGGVDPSQHAYQIDEVAPFDPTTGRPERRDSQGTITSMGSWAANVVNNVAGTAPWPSNFAWRDANNNMVPMTAAQCYAFTQNVATYLAALFGVYCALFATISGATTASAVNSINVAAGWPSNP